MGHANPKIEAMYTQINYAQLVEAISLLPDWNSHKTSTSAAGQEKGLRAEYPQPLVFPGAEEGS
jgi:hypothetical protein